MRDMGYAILKERGMSFIASSSSADRRMGHHGREGARASMSLRRMVVALFPGLSYGLIAVLWYASTSSAMACATSSTPSGGK